MSTSGISMTDMFCGAGGTSEAARRMGIEVVYALNHWERAIETHQRNHPQTEHILMDVHDADPRQLRRTTLLAGSPSCVNHSLAQGKKRKHLAQMTLPLDEEILGPPLTTEAEERSRCTMWDPQRWAKVHRYEYIILENVVDVALWSSYGEWLREWERLDRDLEYEYKVLYLNSQFFLPCPQSRDRWYFVAWRKGNRVPKLDFRPPAYCPVCSELIGAIQPWKNPARPWGRYGRHRQYVYRCPRCASEVVPLFYAAFNAIDWTLPIQRIGDRKKPLEPKTMARIEKGLQKFRSTQPFTVQLNKTTDRLWPVISGTLPTQTADNSQYLVNPFLIRLCYENEVTSANQPMPTQTARQDLGLTLPPFIFGMNHQFRVKDAYTEPTLTMTTDDENGLAYPQPFLIDHVAEYRLRDILGPLSTIVGSGNHQSVILPQPFLMDYRGDYQLHGIKEPLSTIVAGGNQQGLITPLTEAS